MLSILESAINLDKGSQTTTSGPGSSCYLIGSSSLAIQCGDILMKAGYLILGVMSEDPQVTSWAMKQGLLWTDDFEIFQATLLKEGSFDYLFSIYNKHILSPEILHKPSKFAINCHDGPLPKYAGANATAWAILNGVQFHGITWHIVSEILDAGDIIKQVIFPIDPDETAWSLNLKCYEHAYLGFMELVTELSTNSVIRVKQDLQKRSFFNAYNKPRGNGLIQWNCTAEEIARMYRALNFGEYCNPMALPKFKFGENTLIPQCLAILDQASNQPPGTIVRIDTQSIEVATKTRNILLEQFTDLMGQSIDINTLSNLWNVHVGSILISPSPACIQAIDEASLKFARYEQFWVKQFSRITEFIEQPFIAQSNTKARYASSAIELNLPAQFKNLAINANQPMAVLTLLLIYLYRISNHQNLTLYFSNRKIKGFSNESRNMFSDYVPLSTNFTAESNFEYAFQYTLKALGSIEKHGTYATDIFSRYPALTNYHTLHWAIDIVDNLDSYTDNFRSSMTIAINPSGSKFRIFSDSTLVYHNPEKLANTLAAHLRCLANSILLDNDKSIPYLDFIPSDELTNMLVKWNNTTSEFPSDKTITQIFEEQLQKTPDRIAVDSEDERLTYRELNEKANQLAHYLKDLFTTPETLVAIYLDRSVNVVISILAILKAGGAYVPIDTSHAQEYIKGMLTNVAIIITQHQRSQQLIANALVDPQIRIVEIDEESTAIAEKSSDNPSCLITAQNLAYVIYTSGSTGQSKGVLIEHQSVVNLAFAQRRICRITEDSCVLAFASFSFDASVLEIFSCLFSGARLYIAQKEEIMPGEPFINTVQKNNVTVAILPPILLEMTNTPSLLNLKTILLGGDVISEKINQKWNRDGLLFINGYGPTETTVCSTLKVCEANVRPTIGKPIDNTVVYVLDEYCQPVPVGVIGELYIGGVGVARGYLNKPELTRQKFIPNPFSNNPENPYVTLYKSGDRARWLPDGDLEYKGRVDEQVKIRGYRIELSAIESVMQTYPFVQQAVVTTLIDANEQRYLVGYIVPTTSEQNFDLNTLRQYLADRIPAYMIPQSFVVLDQLPINVNGKVDKKSLPPPKKHLLVTDAIYVAPTTEVEIELVKVWSRILNVENIGINDNFFNLGGHSLLVTEALLHIKKTFNINLSIKRFFDEPTISQLAKLIDHEDNNAIDELDTLTFLKDAVLPKDMQIRPISLPKKKISDAVLLTGATGFLGVHLLSYLYSLSTAKIYCLIRGSDYSEALAKMNKNILKYRLPDLLNSKRIVFLLGDLSQKHLGLTEEIFTMLTHEIDAIYHSGAFVNHIYDFESLKKTNVDSTLEVIRLASTGKQKKLHYISALNASVDVSHKPVIKENFPGDHTTPVDLHSGYCQTKWVSEKLLAQAKDYGLLVNIYRPNWISGQFKTGIWEAENNHLLNFIKSCIQIGYAPDKNFSFEMWPVDCISEAIVKISLNGPQHNSVYNFTNPHTPTWHNLVDWLNQNGHPLAFVPVSDWRRHCFDNMTKSNALYPFASLYLQDTDWLSALSQEKIPRIESSHTAAVLKSLGINYPNIDATVLKVYFDYLYKINFIQTNSFAQRLQYYAGSSA